MILSKDEQNILIEVSLEKFLTNGGSFTEYPHELRGHFFRILHVMTFYIPAAVAASPATKLENLGAEELEDILGKKVSHSIVGSGEDIGITKEEYTDKIKTLIHVSML